MTVATVSTVSDEQINQLIDFIIEYMPHYKNYKDRLAGILKEHIIYNTLDTLYKDGKVIAVVRYNINFDTKTADILDLIVRKGEEGKKIVKYFVARGWSRFPYLEYVQFKRALKYNETTRIYRINKFL